MAISIIMVAVSTCFFATCVYTKAFIEDLKTEMRYLNSYLDQRFRHDQRYSLEIKKNLVDIIEFHIDIYE